MTKRETVVNLSSTDELGNPLLHHATIFSFKPIKEKHTALAEVSISGPYDGIFVTLYDAFFFEGDPRTEPPITPEETFLSLSAAEALVLAAHLTEAARKLIESEAEARREAGLP